MSTKEEGRIATSDVYNSTTGVYYRAGDWVPYEGNEELFVKKTGEGNVKSRREGQIPGFEESELVVERTHVAGEGRAKAGAGQDGQKPAPAKPRVPAKPAKAAAAPAAEAAAEEAVEVGGPARAAAAEAPAKTGSALD